MSTRIHFDDPFALELQDYRQNHHISMAVMAELCGVSRQTMYNIESGRSVASRETELKIREVMERNEGKQ